MTPGLSDTFCHPTHPWIPQNEPQRCIWNITPLTPWPDPLTPAVPCSNAGVGALLQSGWMILRQVVRLQQVCAWITALWRRKGGVKGAFRHMESGEEDAVCVLGVAQWGTEGRRTQRQLTVCWEIKWITLGEENDEWWGFVKIYRFRYTLCVFRHSLTCPCAHTLKVTELHA